MSTGSVVTSLGRTATSTLLLWLPLLLFELVEPNSANQILSSPVLLKGVGLSMLVLLGISGALALAAALFAKAVVPTFGAGPSLAIAMLSSALVFPLLSYQRQLASGGTSPELATLVTVMFASIGAGALIAAVCKLAPERMVGPALTSLASFGTIAFAYQVVQLRLVNRGLGRPLLSVGDPRIWILGLSIVSVVTRQLLHATRRSDSRGARGALIAATLAAPALALTCHLWWPIPASIGLPMTNIPPREAMNVVVLMIDTIRADHTTIGGYSKPTTPFLEELAASRATYFSQATSPGSSTWPSTAAMFTSLYPYDLVDYDLPGNAKTISGTFHEAGYETAGFTANSLIDRPNLRRSFDHFETYGGYRAYRESFLRFDLLSAGDSRHAVTKMAQLGLHKVHGDTLVGVAAQWLRAKAGSGRPFFLYVHLIDPHWPYYDRGYGLAPALPDGHPALSYIDLLDLREQDSALREEARSGPAGAHLRGRYDEEIRAADGAAKKLVDTLNDLAVDESTMLVVVGDHGEEFLEHGGFGHGHDVYDEQTHVPFLIRWPKGVEFEEMPALIEQPVSLVDVLPTLTDYVLRLKPKGWIDGRSLRAAVEGTVTSRPVLSMSLKSDQHWLLSYREGHLKTRLEYAQVGKSSRPPRIEVFDVRADRGETRPLADNTAHVRQVTERARQTIDPIWDSRPGQTFYKKPSAGARKSGKPDDAAMERLRALGYID